MSFRDLMIKRGLDESLQGLTPEQLEELREALNRDIDALMEELRICKARLDAVEYKINNP